VGEASEFSDLIELRYLALVRLGARLAVASDWSQVATSVADGLSRPNDHPLTRLWGKTSEGFEELARSAPAEEYPKVPSRQLAQAAEQSEPTIGDVGGVLVGLHAGGVSLGVLEVCYRRDAADFVAQVAPIVACRVALLAAQGLDNLLLSPLPVDAASDASAVMSAFAVEAKRMLDHDRLSAYLLSDDGRSFERFAVATSPIIPGEGLVIPFGDVGLRHVVITNRPLVSADLGRDARIVGREDRIIATAGFRGLLSVPLRLRSRPIGVLNFVSREAGFYRDQDIPVAQQIADQITAFLENLRRQRGMRDVIQREATERERVRLTSELYRSVSESALAVTDVATGLSQHLRGRDGWAARQVDSIIALSKLALANARRAVSDLSPMALESHTFEEAVESAVAQLRRAAGIDVKLELAGDTSTLPPAVSRAAYYILQEALANVRQHSNASRVRVEVRCAHVLSVIVTDDGDGFDQGRATTHMGFGLPGMLERAQALAGSLSVDSNLDAGTTVRLDLPLSGASRFVESVITPPAGQSGAGALRVVVAHPLPAMRAGLAAMLEGGQGIRVVGMAGTIEEAEGSSGWLQPDVILLDLKLAGSSLADCVGRLARCSPSSRVLLITSTATSEPQETVTEAGASGSVSQQVDGSGLVEAVRAVAGGATVIAGGPGGETTNGAAGSLSRRELEILRFIASGHTNMEIGKALYLAPKTIERHVATIIGKLGARNRAHAAGLAIAEGLVLFAPDDHPGRR
jgi:signal transduction histidine kinase/DNA-binding NarL/FixJ family response regulator